MKRILLVGLDGASPHLVRAWRDSLPNLHALMAEGASGTLQSTIPPRSVPAWYSFVTGVNPAKLGVFGFSQRRPATYDYTFANFSHCRAEPFWRWLEPLGLRSAILHVPGTFPPRELSGFMVSGWPMPLNRGNLAYTYPQRLGREIDDLISQPFEAVSPHAIGRDNEAQMLAERLRILKMHGDVACHLLEKREWDVGLVVFSPLDRTSHQFWRHMDASHPHHDPRRANQFGDAIKQVYAASDAQLGRLLSLLDDEDWIFVVSDHGFGPSHRSFFANEFLQRHGYLVLRDNSALGEPGAATRILGRLSAPLFHLNQASPLFRRVAAPLKKTALSNFIRNRYMRSQVSDRVRLNHVPVDWSQTRAYCPDESSIYLNLRGRDPQGTVAPGKEASALIAELSGRLSQLRDPATGATLAVNVWRKEEIYSGPYLDDAPDLIVALDNYRTNVMAELGHGELFDEEPLWSGNHAPDGIFLARGPGIVAGRQVDANIMDVVPTLLHMLGAAVPRDADGRVLLELFEDGSDVRRREVELVNAAGYRDRVESFSDEEQAEMAKQLKDLGYLG